MQMVLLFVVTSKIKLKITTFKSLKCCVMFFFVEEGAKRLFIHLSLATPALTAAAEVFFLKNLKFVLQNSHA